MPTSSKPASAAPKYPAQAWRIAELRRRLTLEVREQRQQTLHESLHQAQQSTADKAQRTAPPRSTITRYAQQVLHSYDAQRNSQASRNIPLGRNAQGHLTLAPGEAAWDLLKALTGPMLNRFGMKNASP